MSYESDDKMVSHPDHYNSGKFEVIDIIEEFTKDLSGIEAVDTGNAIKYVLRWHKKNGVQDIKKAIWYLTHLAEHLEGKENPSKPHSVIIHKLSNGNYAIEDKSDQVETQTKKKNHCGTCAHQWDTDKCPRMKRYPGTINCENTDPCCDEWTPAVKPLTNDETIAKDFIEDVSKVEDQLDKKEYDGPDTVFVTGEPIDNEKPSLSVEAHINAAGVIVPDSQPWSSVENDVNREDERTCHNCGYYLRKHDLEPCKSCTWYSNWKPKEHKEEE